MKNRRKIFQRAAALLCCIILLPSLVAVPAYAESDNGFFDVLQFGTANGSGYQSVTGTLPFEVVYQTTQEPFFYVDAVIVSPTMVFLEYNGTQLNRQMINYSNGAYRFRMYGDLVGDPSGYLTFRVISPGNEGASASVIFEQLRISSLTLSQSVTPSVGTVLATPYEWIPSETMPDPQTPATITLKSQDTNLCVDFFSKISLSEWKKFDYLDVYFSLRVASISSIDVSLGGLYLPYELSYLESSFFPDASWSPNEQLPADNLFNCCMRIDLTSVNRTLSSEPIIFINGLYAPYNVSQGVTLQSVTGIVVGSVPSETATLWQRLQGLLVALFGSDPAATAANQAQVDYQSISQEIVVDAMTNWDANIDYAESGFNSSIQFVAPALMWASTLASSIYNNLGVFRSLYLLVGLMSVIMLLLSKSGVAAKISNSVGRGSGGGKNNA